MKRKILNWNDPVSMRKVISLLAEGNVLVGPSDTVPGFYATATEENFLSLNRLKKRSKKPYLLLISSQDELCEWVNEKDLLQAEKLMKAFWPGPLTLLLKVKESAPAYLSSEQGTIAVRMPNHPQVLELLKGVGQPLFSTSANQAGDPVPSRIVSINEAILDNVAAIIDDGCEQKTTPSTIVDASTNDLTIVREGAYSKESLKDFISTNE